MGTTALKIVWRERDRFGSAVVVLAFSSLLMAFQSGLLLGFLSVASRPIDGAVAEIWVGAADVPSIGFSQPIPEAWTNRLGNQPEVERIEPYILGFGDWHTPEGRTALCYVSGARLDSHSLGALNEVTPEMRARLAEPGAVVVAESDRATLGLSVGLGETAEVCGRRVRVVGLMKQVGGVGMMPGVFCSLRTARLLLPEYAGDAEDQATYLLARCRRRDDAVEVVRRLRGRYPGMTVLTQAEFSERTRLYWLTKSKGGGALGLAALLSLIVGTAVTCNTLYRTTADAKREYAVFRALGIPGWRVMGLVLAQAFWVGVGGMVLAGPLVFGLALLGGMADLDVRVDGWLLGAVAALTITISLLSGLVSLHALRLAEPIQLLR